MSFTKVISEGGGLLSPESTEPEQGVVKMDRIEDVLPRLLDLCRTVINYQGTSLTISPNQPPQPNIVHPKLSLREAEVLQYLANGLSPEQTALKMNIKTRTVRKYLGILRKKFDTESRDQLMARAGYLRLCDPYGENPKTSV